MTTTRDIETSDGAIRTRIIGSGPPVFFVHGALVDGRLWDRVVERLADRFTCIVPDLPLGSHVLPLPDGADRTPAGHARRIAEVLEALDLRDVTLVGNDTGGALCQLVAVHHPERLGRLVLTNCDALEVFPPAAFFYLGLAARLPLAMAAIGSLTNALPVLARAPNAYGWLSTTRIPDDLLRAWVRPSLDPAIRRDTGGLFRAVHPSVTMAAARGLRGFERPVRLVWGTDDVFFTTGLAERLVTYPPDATLVRVPGASCYVPLDRPDAVADEISAMYAARERAA